MVEVTQADREAAASIAVLVEMRELIREGRADHHAEPFARHRIAARDASLEEAAKVVEKWIEPVMATPHENATYRSIATAIRAMKGPSNA
jgi:hypothetical protein